jgi:hypothetical protein
MNINLGEIEISPSEIHVSNVRGMISGAMGGISPDDVAYLFATGKSELEIRNALALHLHHNLAQGQIVIREWKRHDLAVLDSKLEPLMILEGKVWSHTDVITSKKLMKGQKSIRAELEKDLQKLAKAADKYPGVAGFITIVLFSIDIDESDSSAEYRDVVKYASLHRRGIQAKEGLENLANEGHGKMIDFLETYGESISLPIFAGSFHGMTVKSEIFILKPELTLLDEYHR